MELISPKKASGKLGDLQGAVTSTDELKVTELSPVAEMVDRYVKAPPDLQKAVMRALDK